MDDGRNDSDDPRDLLPLGDLSFQMLLVLGDGPAHGYGIGKELERRTGGRLRPTTGSLYQALRRLEDDGLVEQTPGPPGSDPRRQYFRMTSRGRQAAGLEAGRLHRLVEEARARNLFPA
ncbi:MAG TPA: PadR family transcriptional regulator [Longimicrobiales bacterium]|nr:PadR family transcriptional regulator [Longimicrobiales bacterium]